MTDQPVNVLLLAAGFGTRLGELTKSVPKALVKIGHTSTIDYALWQLKRFNLTEVFINLHHLGEQIERYLGDGAKQGLKITYSREDPILDTGGAIKRILSLDSRKDLLVFNCDAVFGHDLDLNSFIGEFSQSGAIARVLVVPAVQNEVPLWIKSGTSKMYLRQIGGDRPEGCDGYTFSGIQLLSKRVTKYTDQLGEIFGSFKSLYPLLLNNAEQIEAQKFSGYWQDTGTPERMSTAEAAYKKGLIKSMA